jgi:Na+/H+ antiporter NhaC
LFLIPLLLSFSLLIFPQINSHYSLSLTLPLLVIYVLWYEKYGEKVVLAFLIIYLALSSSVFLGNFFTWVIIAMICYRSKEIKTYAQHE